MVLHLGHKFRMICLSYKKNYLYLDCLFYFKISLNLTAVSNILITLFETSKSCFFSHIDRIKPVCRPLSNFLLYLFYRFIPTISKEEYDRKFYRVNSGRETRVPGENPDLSQVTDKLYHIMLY
jgi:hypothetical protein